MPDYLAATTLLISALIAAASQIRLGRLFLRSYIKAIFFFSIGIVLVVIFYTTFQQYQLWLHGGVAKFLLPPYQPISYFVSFSLTHFFVPFLLSFLAAILIFTIATLLNTRYGGIFFERKEPYLAATSFFLVGHPGWLVYSIFLLTVYSLLHLVFRLRGVKDNRLPLYQFWAPVAFFVILLDEYWFSQTDWWQLLVI